MKFRIFFILMTCIAILFGWTALPGNNMPTDAIEAVTAQQNDLIDLDFPGGTAQEFVNAIRKKDRNANIVIMPDAMNIPMPPMELKSVDVGSALRLLEGRTAVSGRETIELYLKFLSGDKQRGERDIYSIMVDGVLEPSHTSIFSVSELLSGDLASDDLMTAIETTLELLAENYTQAQIRYHPATSILIVRGHPDQVQAIRDLIGELYNTAARQRLNADRKARSEKADQNALQWAAKAEQARAEFQDLRLELTEVQARYSLLQRENVRIQELWTRCDAEKRGLVEQNHGLRVRLQEIVDDKSIYADKKD